MSKKNKLSTRRAGRARDLELEQREKAKREEKAAKAAAKRAELRDPSALLKKTKKFRIRKGVRVQGLIVKDSDSKKKALKILAARAALKMDTDDEEQPTQRPPTARASSKTRPDAAKPQRSKQRVKAILVVSTGGSKLLKKKGATGKPSSSQGVKQMDVE